MKNCRCLNWFLVSASSIRIRIWFLKFWFAGSGSGRKWTGSATLLHMCTLPPQNGLLSFCSAFSEDESFIEIDLVNKLQSIVEKQREQIRSLDTSLSDIKSELDEVGPLWSSMYLCTYVQWCGSGFKSPGWIRLLQVKLSYKNPLFQQLFRDLHLFLKMIPNKSSLFNEIPTFLVETKISPKILLLPLKKWVFALDPDPDWEKIPGSGSVKN